MKGLRLAVAIPLLLAGLLSPVAAVAQTAAKVFRIGLLGSSSPTAPEASRIWEGFFQRLRELGYVEGQNILIEGRFYGDRSERLPALAAELVRLKVDVIVAQGPPAPEAAQRATSTIPIVMTVHQDPVGSGLVASLARPGRNVTGLSLLSTELVGKRLQLLKDAVPGLSRVAVLLDPTHPAATLQLREAEVAARSLKVQLQVLEARAPGDFAGAFSAMTNGRAGGLILLGGLMFFVERTRIVELAAQHHLPAIYAAKENAEAGGLMAYGPNLRESYRRAATYVDKILKGAKPAELPIERPTKFELVINMKTAKALGLTIPQSVLARADEVIEK
jgi:putative tryptophan/tyrosine transport system substrate-binding protein